MRAFRKSLASIERRAGGIRSFRGYRWFRRAAVGALALALAAASTEEVCERRAQAALTAGETFVAVSGARLRYQTLGLERAGPLVVLLPGLGASIEQMRFLQPRLAETVRTLSYDRAGYGFSTGSDAHTAEEQAKELAALLDALNLPGTLVLVGYSTSALVARVFAALNPARVAAVYLVEPDHPEFEARARARPTPRRGYVRWVVHDLVTTTFGVKRLAARLAARHDAHQAPAEARANEVLVRRRHFWALAREWYVLPDSFAQAMAAPVGAEPIVVLYTAQSDPEFPLQERLLAEFVRRSPRGRIRKLPNHPHDQLFMPGPVLDAIVEDVSALASAH